MPSNLLRFGLSKGTFDDELLLDRLVVVAAVVTDMEAVVVATLPNMVVVVVIFNEVDSDGGCSALRFRLARFHLATVLWFSG